MAIDEARVKAALTEEEARHFLAQARAPVPEDLEAYSGKIDEYLQFLEDHLALEANATFRGTFPRDTAANLAQRYRDLLDHAKSADEDARHVVVTGVRYFVNPHDVISELENRDGFHDDIRICNFVITESRAAVEPL